MGDNTGLDNVLKGKVENIPTTEAVSRSAKLGHTLFSQCHNHFVEYRSGLRGAVVWEPFLDAESWNLAAQSTFGNGIIVKVVGSNCLQGCVW